MKKSLIFIVAVILLMAASWGLAQEKTKVIEHLGYVETLQKHLYEKYFETPQPFDFVTDPFLTFHVAPSPKAEALFFELQGQTLYTWHVPYLTQEVDATIKLKLTSPLLPENIEVSTTYWHTNVFGIEHNIPGPRQERAKRYWKTILTRESVGAWAVYNTTSPETIPLDQAKKIISDLIDYGCDLELSAYGHVDGVKRFMLIFFTVEATRLIKK